jgi:Raf kinase inhibitor-like YbhB/YbcL family protein
MRKIFSFFLLVAGSLGLAHSALADNFSLTSAVAQAGGTFPVVYTCDGDDISPELNWNNAPSNTKTYALILSDPDAPDGVFFHWVLYNLPRNTHSLEKNVARLPAGAAAGVNSWGKDGYNGPCPPKGTNHHYVFTLYALDKNLQPPASPDAPALMNAMKNHVLSKTQYVVSYTRW